MDIVISQVDGLKANYKLTRKIDPILGFRHRNKFMIKYTFRVTKIVISIEFYYHGEK